MAKHFFILLLLVYPFCSWGDYYYESYFVKGRAYGCDNKPLNEKEILLLEGDHFCFFVTDKSGYFSVEVPYGVFESCTTPRDSIYKGRHEEGALEYAMKRNGDKMDVYCDGSYCSMPNLWYKFYCLDTACHHRNFMQPSPLTNTECLTEKMDIHLFKKMDIAKTTSFYKLKVDSVVNRLNMLCAAPKDSIDALSKYLTREKEYDDSLTAKWTKDGDPYKSSGDPYRYNHPRTKYLDSLYETIILIPYALTDILGVCQLRGRNINSVDDPGFIGLCSSLYGLKKYPLKNEYHMRIDLLPTNEDGRLKTDFIFVTDKFGTIKDAFNYRWCDECKPH